MMNFKKIALSLLITASSLLAIDAVTNLSVSAPHNSGAVTNDASMDFSWTPPANVSKYYYKLDTNSSNYNLVDVDGYETLNSSTASSVTVTATSSGNYYFHIVAVDSSGTPAYDSTIKQVLSTIDLDAGTTTISPSGGSITTETNSITLTGSEAGSIYFTLDGTTPTTSSTLYTTPVVVGVSATVKAILVDTAGNVQSTPSSQTYTIVNNPTITLNDADIDGTTITVDTTSRLKVAGVDLTRYKYKKSTDSTYLTVSDITTGINISALTTGTYTYYVLGGDEYNFQPDSDKTTVTFTIDDTPPTGLAVLVNGVEADETNASTVTFGDDIRFTLTTNDENASIYYTIDNTAPDNIVGTPYPIDGVPIDLLDYASSGNVGQVVVKMIAYSELENASEVKSVTITMDNDAPTLVMPAAAPFYLPLENQYIDSDDNTSTIYYQVTESATAPPITNMSAWDIGSTATIGDPDVTFKYLHAVAIDIAGNKSDVESVTYTYQTSGLSLLSAQTVDFGDIKIGSLATKNLTINNIGTETIDLVDENISISVGDFNISTSNCNSLPSDSSCTVPVTFDASSTGDKNATITITYATTELNVSVIGSVTLLGTAPVITTTDITAVEDTEKVGLITSSDADDDNVTFSVLTTTSNGTLVVDANGSYSYTADSNYNGSDSFVVIANDGDLNSTERNISITISAVNDDPVAVDDIALLTENNSVDITVLSNDTDVDNDTLSVSSTEDGSNGTVTVSDNTVTYTPATDYVGSDSFTYVVSDGTSTDTGTVNITVSASAVVDDNTTTPDDNTTTPDNDTTTPDNNTTTPDDTSTVVTVGNTTTHTIGGEEVEVISEIDDASTSTTESGSVTTASTITDSKTVAVSVQVNLDGTLSNSVTVDGTASDLEVAIIGATTTMNSDGSIEVVAEATEGTTTTQATVELKADGTTENKVAVTIGSNTVETIVNSGIVGSDTTVNLDGSVRITTPVVSLANDEVFVELEANKLGKVTPTYTVNTATQRVLPQFEAGSEVSVKNVNDRVIVEVKTTLTQAITFN